MNKITKTTAAAVVLIVGLSLAGCSTTSEEPKKSPAPTSETTEAPATETPSDVGESTGFAPIELVPADIEDGSTIDLKRGDWIYLVVEGDPSLWKGSSSNTVVAEFVSGGLVDEVIYNPGISALTAGEATISLTDPDGNTKEFTLSITE